MSIDKLNPFPATIKERFPLTKPGSAKETYHVALDLASSGLDFNPGDSIGVFGQNHPTLVQHLLHALKASGEEPILDPRSKQLFSIRDFLTLKANLSRLTSSFLKLLYDYETIHDKKNRLHRLLQTENKPLLSQYLQSHDPLDLLKEYAEVNAPLQELCEQFGPLLPRFYSAASSKQAVPDEVHLTVALSTFTHAGELRYGVASHFLNHLAQERRTPIPVYVLPAHNFRLPADPHTPIILVGPGTGVAPFRAFLQERMATRAPGKNWLFFGECNRAFDFFYEDYWMQLVKDRSLRLDLAFSRDQAEKIYVQHKMHEHAADLWAWLQEGAHFYVCGDAHQMAKDVDAMLQRIAKEQGHLDDDEAKAYVKHLRTEKRYLLDVY